VCWAPVPFWLAERQQRASCAQRQRLSTNSEPEGTSSIQSRSGKAAGPSSRERIQIVCLDSEVPQCPHVIPSSLHLHPG